MVSSSWKTYRRSLLLGKQPRGAGVGGGRRGNQWLNGSENRGKAWALIFRGAERSKAPTEVNRHYRSSASLNSRHLESLAHSPALIRAGELSPQSPSPRGASDYRARRPSPGSAMVTDFTRLSNGISEISSQLSPDTPAVKMNQSYTRVMAPSLCHRPY